MAASSVRRPGGPLFDTVLVANRGEIALRVIRTLRRLGIRSVAVFSDADADAPHARAADSALRLGPPAPAESYLAVDRVLEAAERSGAEAVHPGYGFLAENAAFARACARAGLVFVGPPPEAITAMGDKIGAKATVAAAGVPVVPGVGERGLDDEALGAAADGLGYPLLVKPAAGGGGLGIHQVTEPGALPEALAAARREARGAFGDDALLLERLVERPRHVEVQVLADSYGAAVHLGERECSLQRRHQKVVEEAPCPALDPPTRQRMGAAALRAALACGYTGAGTVEFLLPADQPGEFLFLELNARLQVEHPVTEMVTGLDLVEQQLRIAAGESLGLVQDDVVVEGHALEARVYADDPARGFLPTAGTVLAYGEPVGPGIRVDSGVAEGTAVGTHYDPLLAKVVAHGPDRPTALSRLQRALRELRLLGVTTNVAFLRALLDDRDVRAGRLDTGLAERLARRLGCEPVPDEVLAAAALARLLALEPTGAVVDPFDLPGGWRLGEPAWTTWRLRAGGAREPVTVRVRGRAAAAQVAVGDAPLLAASARWQDPATLAVALDGHLQRYAYAEHAGVAHLGRDGLAWSLRHDDQPAGARRGAVEAGLGPLLAPTPGTVSAVRVAQGERVRAGQTLLVVEAMKMEHAIVAPADGVVAELPVRAGQAVAMDQPLAVVAPAGPDLPPSNAGQ